MSMKKRTNFSICMRLMRLVKPLTGFMILAILLGLAGHLCASFLTIFGGYAALNLLGFPVPVTLGAVFVCVAVFAVMRGVLHYGEQSCNHFIAFKLLALIRDKVFRALRRLCPAKLEGKEKGNLISVITSDIELLEVFYAHTISPVVIAILMSAVMCLFIGSYHPLLGLIALAAYFAVGLLIPVITSKRSGDDGLRFRSRSGDMSSFVLDSLRGLPEMIQYGMGEKRLQEMNLRTDALSSYEKKMKLRTGRSMSVTDAVILLFDMAILFTAALLGIRGLLSFDGVLISVIALMSSYGPVIALAGLGGALQNTFAAGNRVLDLLDEAPAVEEISDRPKSSFSGADTKDLTFSYGGDPILSDISVKIPQHCVIGITGKSGSGKSTLLKLLMRFWKAENGGVRISGRDIGSINTSDLRDMESFVTQETYLFHDTIENNIRIARPDASREEIEAACRKASVHDFIRKLPNGYETPVGELGDTLSGGERQRIGLARAFLHDAPFLLLDEPTSNLDSLNEAVILKSIGEERADKTVVLVSHRQSTMRIADRVYSVEYGRMS